MDLSSSFKILFKSHSSYKHHSPKGSDDDSNPNYKRILFNHPRDEDSSTTSSIVDLHHRHEVIVKIDTNDNRDALIIPDPLPSKSSLNLAVSIGPMAA
ncbi:hypothetical protein LguiA_027151 [Lonicera macranthoides]